MRPALLAVAALLLSSVPAAAQTAIDGIRTEFAAVKAQVMTAANKAPESIYGFQATPEVFTLRKQFLHIADASYSICSGLAGTPGKRPKVDADAPLAKADVLAALTGAFDYCDAALKAATDATLAETVKTANGTARVKSYYAAHLLAHTGLHYGNVVTYMRLNKLSPGEQ
ncbi:hypothetical protein TBR22_A29020 [Luteitalea sp. TBR-22]|uniref:DinB family protein n=1 Tax=Luteitalea sp. TBR-22 TaxID=2802971 RepID=UPI001AF2DC61|nr:DinB family protein [Luteitalea sp. TBR-22]BCS33675.1 hypothetical protein TBR22_A29020 [Luteitalea sp. TBR-22]